LREFISWCFESEKLLASRSVRRIGSPILTAGNNFLAVRREGHSSNQRAVSFERERVSVLCRPPYFGRLILTGTDNQLAVRRKGYRDQPQGVPLERRQFLAGNFLPNLYCLIAASLDYTHS